MLHISLRFYHNESSSNHVLLLYPLMVYDLFLLPLSLPQPFVDASHPLQVYFPDRHYAVLIPAVLLVVGIMAITSFISYVLIKAQMKKKKS